MARIVVWHKVKDFDAWKHGYDNDVPRRKAAGVKEVGIHRGKVDRNSLLIEFEAEPSAVDKMFADPGLKETMHEAGVEEFDYFQE